MSEKRFKVNYEKFIENEYLPCGLIDMGENSHIYKIEDVCDLLNEQQATISQLQDLCGQSDGENAKLRIENKKLKEENEQLKEEIKAYPINEQYAEEIIEQNQKLRIERNGLRRENEQLRQELKDIKENPINYF